MSTLRYRALRVLLVAVVLVAAGVGALFLRLRAGPIALPFLDRPLATALGAIAPELVAEVGSTVLARAGRGIALQVTDARLRAHDGTVLLSLPALAVRPSISALVRGRIVLARIDVADAVFALTRGADGAWRFGSSGAPLAEVLGGNGAGAGAGAGVPRIHLVRTELTIDDATAAGRLRITGGDLLVTVRDERLVVSMQAALDLESAVPPVPGRILLPISAELDAPFVAGGGLGDVAFTLTGDGGELAPAGETVTPMAIADLTAAGTWYPAVETLRFERLAARLGKSRVDSKATVILGAAPFVALDGTVDAVSLDVVTRLWPAELAATVRTWLRTNLPTGTLRRCRVQLAMTSDAQAPEARPKDPAARPKDATARPKDATARSKEAAAAAPAYDIACDFDGVTADYLRPLDPIRGATGSARLTPERLQVEVGTGAVGTCRVAGGTLAMDLTVDPPRATLTANVNGTTAGVLALVDRPPLALVTPLGVVPADVGGESRVQVRLGLPIASEVPAAAIAIEATATLTGASLPQVAGGLGFRDGALEVRVEGQHVTVKGTAALTGLAAVTKPVTVALKTSPGARAAERSATLALDGPELVAHGTATFAGGRLAGVIVERLRFAGSDVGGTVTRRGDTRWDVKLTGATLDLDSLLKEERLTALDDPRLAAGDPRAAAVDYAVELDLGRVRARVGREVRDLRGSIAGTGSRVDAFALDGALAPSGRFHATLDGHDDARRLHVTSDEAGHFLATVADLRQLDGGTLVLDATTDARGPRDRLDGTLVVRDGKVVRAPVLARILAVGSLGGIAALIQGGGMPIKEARVPFRWDGARITLTDVRAIGAIGITADGVVDTAAGGTCDVRGNVIPAYTLNSALGKVPLLGRFLVGGKGQGVFGIDYHVSGKTTDPAVRVNPLTSVAPTVLRRWFVEPFQRR